ncbi:MAG: hypothetical protein AAFR35_13245 [Pseudomonadota bacterium]
MRAETATFVHVASRLSEGRWNGRFHQKTGEAGVRPALSIHYRGTSIDPVEIAPVDDRPGLWRVAFDIPLAALSDGVHTVVIADEASGATLASVTFSAGDALDEDLQAEVHLLRAELDLLKRAFRRHCVETGTD